MLGILKGEISIKYLSRSSKELVQVRVLGTRANQEKRVTNETGIDNFSLLAGWILIDDVVFSRASDTLS